MTVVLGIDLATADARVQAVDVDTGVTLVELHLALEVMGSDGARTQPSRYGAVVRELIAAVTSALGARSTEVRALSITGTSGTVVPVAAAGIPVGDAVLYDDSRGGAELGALIDAGRGRRPSGALARAAWMHQRSPAARYVFTPDVAAAALAGRLLPSDTSHALKSGIDPVAGSWDPAALAAVGLPIECMPDLVHPGRVVGEVANPTALGLPDDVAIVSGMTDGSTAQIATGAVAEGDTVGVLGTTLVLKAVSAHDVVDAASGVYSHVAPDGMFWPGGASNSGAGVLRFGVTAGFDPAAHSSEIAAAGPADDVAYPLARPGERFPISRPDFSGFYLPFRDRDGDVDEAIGRCRAIYEGVAFVERLGLERLAGLGVQRRRHHLAGGTTASEVWSRIRATALGQPVTVSRGASSARGAAAIAASAIMSVPLATIAGRFSGTSVVIDPDPSEVDALEERYRAFRAALGR